MKLPVDMERTLMRMVGEAFDPSTPANVAQIFRDSACCIRRTDDLEEAQKILDEYENGNMRLAD